MAATTEEKQAGAAGQRVLMQPYPRLVSWEQYKENVVSLCLSVSPPPKSELIFFSLKITGPP